MYNFHKGLTEVNLILFREFMRTGMGIASANQGISSVLVDHDEATCVYKVNQ